MGDESEFAEALPSGLSGTGRVRHFAAMRLRPAGRIGDVALDARHVAAAHDGMGPAEAGMTTDAPGAAIARPIAETDRCPAGLSDPGIGPIPIAPGGRARPSTEGGPVAGRGKGRHYAVLMAER